MGKQPGNRQNLLPSIFAVKNRLGNTLKDNPFFLAVLVTLTTFLLYLATLISEVGWGDSAELSLAAYQLGLTHPPGYPLYTILGKAVSAFFTDPAVGVNLLSAACTGLAAGVLSLLIYEFTSAPVIAALGAVIFAVLPNIWDMAVVSEVYNVNIFFLGTSIYLFVRSEQSQFTKHFVSSAVLFGLSLGTYQANLLLLPAFLWALYAGTPREKILSRLFAFCSIIGSIWLVFIGYSAVRSHAALAINYPLNSAREILSYITGAGLRPSYPGTIAFYIDRTIQHAGIFSKNFLYLPIPVGVLGAFALFKQKRIPGLFLVFAFAINYLFFSYYAVSDYFTMPVPAYFIFCIWIGCGLAVIASWLAERKSVWKFVSIFICLLVIGGQLAGQLPARLERSNTHPVTDLIIPAMNSFPQNAVVISRWERYAPMVYFQQVRKMRGDITLVVSYDYLDQIDTYLHNTPARPVFIDNNDKTLIKNYKIERYYRRWFIILAPIGK